MRTLEDGAKRARARIGADGSRRQAASALAKPPYGVKLNAQRISAWLPDNPDPGPGERPMQVPRYGDAAIEAAVWALIRLWSDWAGAPAPDRAWWMRLLEDAQPSRTRTKPSAPNTSAARVVYLPARAEEAFVGRADELARLDDVFSSAGRAGVLVGQRTVGAVHGLGGIGKSTLAAHWARAHLDEHQVTWWITANTPSAVHEGLAALGAALNPPLAGQPLEVLAEHALAWLAAHQDWVLVLDNVTRHADIEPVLARCQRGRVLITSRLATGWHPLTDQVITLGVLPLCEAVELLTRIVSRTRTGADLDSADELCQELGCLPLAVEQAAGFIAETGGTPHRYLKLLAEYPGDLYSQPPAGSDIDRTVARVWRATLDHLATDTPGAGPVLRVLAWFAPDDVPRPLLEPLADDVGGPVALERAIGRLAAYNMITLTAEGTVAVHRLVQALARTPDAADPHRQEVPITIALYQATHALERALPGDSQDPAGWPAWRTLLPHIDALISNAPLDADTATTIDLFNNAGLFLAAQGTPDRAIDYLQRAMNTAHRLLGSDHPDALRVRNNLAGAYESAGDLGRAVPLLEATLADGERVLGIDDRLTLATRNNLAAAYQQAGDLARAISLFEQTLADRERALGADHHETLLSRHTLAGAYRDTGDLARAIQLYEQNLADQERLLGTDHPNTLLSRHNLARAYRDAGDLGRAIPLLEEAMADQERTQGADHPDALTARHNLAHAYWTSGDLERAIPLLETTLADCERVLGTDHRLTMWARSNLAGAYGKAGDLMSAVRERKRAMADQERVLGADHPDTLQSRQDLAYDYLAARNLRRAIPLLEAALADCERVLGGDHPNTLTARNNLAGAYQEDGDPERAIPLHERNLADRERVLGADHPDTLESRHNLGYAYRLAGDLGRAISLYEKAFADRMRVLGADHPDTLTSRNNLAGACWATGDLGRAIRLYEGILADCLRLLGAQHELTRTVQTNLTAARAAQSTPNG